jgi:radical SAM superfamily enzyme YgiQ (UPF0313 family)
MKYEKIALVNPPLDDGVVKCIDDGFWQPLNLLTLSSYLKFKNYPGEIRIFDQAVMDLDEIWNGLREFQPDLTALSPNMDSYEQTLRIAEMIKLQGSEVILGGAYATTLSKNILVNRQCVDYVITHDGEIPLYELVSGVPLESVSNLVYRQAGQVAANKVKFNDKASLCEIDYSDVDMYKYFDNYANSLHPGNYKRPLTTITQRGCVWREKTRGCIFCSRINPTATFDHHDDVWSRIGRQKDLYGIDCMIDVGDDFLGNKEWFYNFYNSRPASLKDIGTRFIYSRVEHINEETADMLYDLNVSEICLGLESGDKQILRNVRKGNTPEQHMRVVKLLAERDIKIISAFMLGHPAESEFSIKTTTEHIKKILEFKNTSELVISIFTPLPGSQAYNMLMEKNDDFTKRLYTSDVFDVRYFQQEWAHHFCEVDFDTIMDYAQQVSALHNSAYVEFTGAVEEAV